MNTQTLSHNIPVFNVNGFPNEAGQISKVVDVVLYYKTHSERMLLAVSGLGKQNLILGYDWLKDHNPKIDWKKEEVEMTHCPLHCEGGHALRKEQTRQKRIKLQALWSCWDGPTPLLQEELESEEESSQTYHPSWELGDWLYLTHLLPEPDQVDLRATTMTSQRLAEEARCSTHNTNISRKKPDAAPITPTPRRRSQTQHGNIGHCHSTTRLRHRVSIHVC